MRVNAANTRVLTMSSNCAFAFRSGKDLQPEKTEIGEKMDQGQFICVILSFNESNTLLNVDKTRIEVLRLQ